MEVFIFLLCATLYIFIARHFLFRSTIKNQPPGPIGLPIIGSFLQLGSKPHESLSRLAKRYGPLMTLRLGSITTIVASSPELAKEILQKQDLTFSNRPIPDAMASMPNPEGLIAWNTRDHRWRNRRRLCSTRLFTAQQLDSLQHLRHEKVRQMLAHIRKHCDSNTQVDIGQVCFATMLNLMSNTIFSTDVVDPDFKAAEEFKELIGRIMESAGKPNLSDYFPALKMFDLQGVRRYLKPSYVRLHEIFDQLIDQRLKSRDCGPETAKSGDFLDVLLDQRDEDAFDFSLQTIKTLILELFMAGSDTSGITTEWTMAELIRNPDVMHKARREVFEVIGRDGEVKESDIEKLQYLQAVVKETMRFHSPSPFLLPYIAGNDTQLGGFTIRKGSHVIVNAWAITQDSNYWEEPQLFKPERFLDCKKDFKGRDFDYIPFGAGPRICPAIPLATRMIHLMVASMIHSFDWKLPDGVTPENMDMDDIFGVTLKKSMPLYAIPVMEETKLS